jgi:hypothetical protein
MHAMHPSSSRSVSVLVGWLVGGGCVWYVLYLILLIDSLIKCHWDIINLNDS